MRTLTVKRNKSTVMGMVSMQVYVEDDVNGTMLVSGVPSRHLGEIHNGEEKSFPIDERAQRLFVTANPMVKRYYNEPYDIPAGTENVYVSGKNYFNSSSGNSFYFDNVTDEYLLKKRKSNKRNGVLFVMLMVAILMTVFILLPILSAANTEPKDFSAEGVTITLTNKFEEEESDEVGGMCLVSGDVVVFITNDPYDEYEELRSMTAKEYAEWALEALEAEAENGIELTDFGCKFMYLDKDGFTTYCYRTSVYKTDDSFKVIQFFYDRDSENRYENRLNEWEGSVRID